MLYSIRNKQNGKLLGVKMDITLDRISYSFSEEPQFLYVHLSKVFVERAMSGSEYYDGSWLHPYWGILAPENYEVIMFEKVEF